MRQNKSNSQCALFEVQLEPVVDKMEEIGISVVSVSEKTTDF